MVASNADAYYRYEYSVQGGGATLPDYAIDYYVKLYTRDRTPCAPASVSTGPGTPTSRRTERQKTS